MAGRAKAQNDWQNKNRDRINLTVLKGQKEIIDAHAAAHGESTTAFINRAINEAMARDRDIDEIEETIKKISVEQGISAEDTRVNAVIMSAIGTLKDFIPNIQDLYISSRFPKSKPRNPKPTALKKKEPDSK